MINHYHIRMRVDRATLVDERDGRQWHFAGGYDPIAHLVTQIDCDRLVTWLGERTAYDGSLLEALQQAGRL